MGVITTCRLPEGTTFGPVPPSVTLADPIVLIGHRTSDTPSDIHTVKLDLASFSSGVMHLVEWVPYVQAARDPQEQNMEAVIDDDDHQLYFRVTRTVVANGELLIWYSDKLAARIGVPEIREDCIRGDMYSCPSCHETFVYPNCIRAHLRFRCKYRQQQLITGPTIATPSPPAIQSSYGLSPTSGLANFHEAAIALETASFARQRAASPLGHENHRRTYSSQSPRMPIEGRAQNGNERDRQTPADERVSTGIDAGKRNSTKVGSGARRRRYLDESASSADERNAPSPTRYPRSKITRRSSPSPITCRDDEDGDISYDDTNDDDASDTGGSAFHHVTRGSPTISSPGAAAARCGSVGSESLAASSAATPPPGPFSADLSSSASLMNSALALPGADKASAVAAAAAAMMGGVFLFPQIAAARAAAAAAVAARAAGVSLPLGMQQHHHHHHERLRAAAAAQLPGGFTSTSIHDSAASLFYHNLNNNNNNNNHIGKNAISSKFPVIPGVFTPNYEIPAQPQAHTRPTPSPQNPLPFVYRSPNPMVVDKMMQMLSPPPSHAPPTTTASAPQVPHHTQQQQQQLHPPQQQQHNNSQSARLPTASQGVSGPLQSTLLSLNLSQNWCAKCNTSFRMTSDLVYHMRSHHKRDFDPVKRRKDDKLRCDVCGETFRERHHLTRHMTSHS